MNIYFDIATKIRMCIYITRVAGACVLLSIFIGSAEYQAMAQSRREPSPSPAITVPDLIGLTWFGSGEARNLPGNLGLTYADSIRWSPNYERVAILVNRGQMASNSREWTLRIYRASDLMGTNPRPERTLVMSGNSSWPAIFDLRWIDETTVAFQGSQADFRVAVYTWDIREKKAVRQTGDSRNIMGFNVTRPGGVVAYISERQLDPEQLASMRAHGFAVPSGARLLSILGGSRNWVGEMKGFSFRGGRGVINNAEVRFVDRSGHDRVVALPAGNWEWSKGIHLSPDNTRALMARLGRQEVAWTGRVEWVIVTIATGEVRPLSKWMAGYNSRVAWLPDGKSVVVTNLMPTPPESQSSSEMIFGEVNVNTGEVLRISDHDNAELQKRTGLSFLKYGVLLDIAWNSKEGSIDVKGDERYPGFIAGVGSRARFVREGSRWRIEKDPVEAVSLEIEEGPNLPWRLVSTDKSGKKNLVLDPNADSLKHKRLGRVSVETVTYGTKLDGRDQYTLYWPIDYQEGRRYPLVIQGHGTYPQKFLPNGDSSIASCMAGQALTGAEMFVVQMQQADARRPLNGRRAATTGMLEKVEALIADLDRRQLVDTSRIALTGYSTNFNGWLYFMSHSRYPVAAASLCEGVDFGYLQYIVGVGDQPEGYETHHGGNPWEEPSRTSWSEYASKLTKINAAIRLDADEDGLIEVWETFAGLRRFKKPVEVFWSPEGSHGRIKSWDRFATRQGTVDWLRFWMQGYERTEPVVDAGETKSSLAEMYARWRELKAKTSPKNTAAAPDRNELE